MPDSSSLFPNKVRPNNGAIPPVTDDERDQLRDEYDEVLVKTTVGHQAMFHIPADGDPEDPVCIDHSNVTDDVDLQPKDIEVYPKSWKRPWCKHCLREWRGGSHD